MLLAGTVSANKRLLFFAELRRSKQIARAEYTFDIGSFLTTQSIGNLSTQNHIIYKLYISPIPFQKPTFVTLGIYTHI